MSLSASTPPTGFNRPDPRSTHRADAGATYPYSVNFHFRQEMIATLQSLMQHNITIEGIYDTTQMERVNTSGTVGLDGGLEARRQIVEVWAVGGKHSARIPTSKHDFMHNKVLVANSTVVAGSFNFSSPKVAGNVPGD